MTHGAQPRHGNPKYAVATAIALAVSAFAASGALAERRPADCTLVVKGKSYIKGVCQFEVDPDGSFRIFSKDYFAYVFVNGNAADASWNADPKSSHAQAPLGALTRKGACWVNATAQICARALAPAKAAAAVAAQPKGEMIYPDFPGASQSCIVPRGMKWADGVELTLNNCPNDKSANMFVRSGGTITIDQRPGLCVGIARGAHRGIVQLEKCAGAATQWKSKATSVASAPVISNMDECWAVPDLDNPKAKFPFALEGRDCAEKPSKTVKFFFEKS